MGDMQVGQGVLTSDRTVYLSREARVPPYSGVPTRFDRAVSQTRETQEALTPAAALGLLREGNRRFLANDLLERSWSREVAATSQGQFPFAFILGCIDSRVPAELVFDQGLGDVFTARVAGNVLSSDVLGSMEFACRLAGAKLVVVMGHRGCGAVQGAIEKVRLGHLSEVVRKIQPAIEQVRRGLDADHPDFADRVAEASVGLVIQAIRERSDVLRRMESDGEILLVGAMYDVTTGEVRFLDPL